MRAIRGTPGMKISMSSSKGAWPHRRRFPIGCRATLIEALDAFRTDPLVPASLGKEFQGIYLRQKTKEWERDFYKVSEEERSQMMEFL